jgi:hypothetical protein
MWQTRLGALRQCGPAIAGGLRTLETRMHIPFVRGFHMPDDVITDHPGFLPPAGGVAGTIRRISWSAVWAGVMAAIGMEILFTLFGFFIGFGMYDARAANPWRGIGAWSTLWFVVTAGWSMFFGAWCAAHLSGNPIPGDGIMHGITTWGLATAVTFTVATVGSWVVLREGINLLATAAIAAEQTAPSGVMHLPPAAGTSAATAQATANILSYTYLRICGGVLIGFLAAILGGWLGRSRAMIVTPEGVVPMPTRRAA